MSERRTYSDEELTAYLDGEAEHAPLSEIESALGKDPGLRRRLDALTIERSQIQSAFDHLLSAAPEPPDVVVEDVASGPVTGWRRTGIAAAVGLLCAVLGWSAGQWGQSATEQTWQDYVATYQALYVGPTLVHIEQSPVDAEQELARVSTAIDKDLDLSSISSVEQLDYKRAQILGFEGQPLIQLAFLSKVGAPIALCIMRAETQSSAGVALTTLQGLSAATWTKDGFDYILIGGGDEAMIASAASAFAEIL